ncbi:MAG: hypothetical protein QXT63_01455 [Thermoplasmata archaeon]
MKTLSQALIDEKKKQNVTTFFLIKIGSYHYTDCNKPIVYNSDTYNPIPLQISGIKLSDANTLDGCQIQLGNVNLEFLSLVLNNLLKNQEVYIYEAWFNSSMDLIDVELIFSGKVDGRPGINEMWATITVAPHLNPWTQRFPRRRITKKEFPFLPERGTKFVWGSTIMTVK